MKNRQHRTQRSREAQPPTSRRVSRRAISIAAAVIIVVAAVAGGYLLLRSAQPASGVATPAGPPPNILLVTLDTTRADHLGSYGWARARTPELDRLAHEGVRFEHAFSPVPVTLPAHASLMTGRYPFANGVRNNGNFYLSDKFETLATILKGQGYQTAAFVSSFVLDKRYGLQRGFDTYDDRMDATQGEVGSIVNLEAERRGDHTAAALDAWLTAYGSRPGKPFFAWLHLYDPHEPYWPPQPFRGDFAGALYDGEIAFDDAIVGRLMERLGELGLLEGTLVAIAGDHGESLGDHGEETHGMFVYDSAIRVPLILWRPGMLKAAVVRDPVRLTDIAPTLLDLVGAKAAATFDGRSLRPLIAGAAGAAAAPIYAETFEPQFNMNWAPLRAVRDDRWKYIEAPRPELYDLAADPAESRNVYDERPQTVRGLRQALEKIAGGTAGAASAGAMDRQTIEKLASLGYVGAGSETALASAGAVRPDPKDMIVAYNRLRHANTAIRERRFADALKVLREVLAQNDRNAFALVSLGGAYMELKDYRAAIAQYRRYVELVPASASGHGLIATCYARLGDHRNAVREADAALAIDPRFSDARVLKSAGLIAQGQKAAALAEIKAGVETDPTQPRLRFELGKLLAEEGDAAGAEAQYRAALELQPDYPSALAGLGTLYARTNRYELAAQVLQRAVTVAPRQDEASYNLATVYERLGRFDEARAEYRRLATASGTPPAVAAAARKQLAALERTGK